MQRNFILLVYFSHIPEKVYVETLARLESPVYMEGIKLFLSWDSLLS